jgi:hypothetical protein
LLVAPVMSLLRVLSLALLSLASASLVACAGSDDAAPEVSDASGADLSAAPAPGVDATAIANAESFFNDLLYHGEGDRKAYEITYAKLPPNIGKPLIHDNPHPKDDDWSPEAFASTFKNAAGKDVKIFLVMDGIDDEGENDTLYDIRGKQLASGDTYRSDLPTWETTKSH